LIPSIDEIFEMLLDGKISFDQAEEWVRAHVVSAGDMSRLRDHFAGHALQAFAQDYVHDNSDEIADKCYTLADAMMKARAL
jgi:hypothetical protein